MEREDIGSADQQFAGSIEQGIPNRLWRDMPVEQLRNFSGRFFRRSLAQSLEQFSGGGGVWRAFQPVRPDLPRRRLIASPGAIGFQIGFGGIGVAAAIE